MALALVLVRCILMEIEEVTHIQWIGGSKLLMTCCIKTTRKEQQYEGERKED